MAQAELPDAFAHTPHNDIFGIVLSPGYEQDKTALTLSPRDPVQEHRRRSVVAAHRQGTRQQARPVHARHVVLRRASCLRRISRGRHLSIARCWTILVKANEGLGALDINQLAASPIADGVVYASGPGGLFRSVTAGATWEAISGIAGTVSAIGYSPADANTVLVGDSAASLPRLPRRRHHMDHEHHRWCRSDQGDRRLARRRSGLHRNFERRRLACRRCASSVRESTTDCPGAAASSITLSPNYASDATVWTSMSDTGVFVSHDRGGAWTRMPRGTTSTQADEPGYEDRPQFGQLRVASGGATPATSTLFLAGFNGLFMSQDGGQQWHEVETLSSSIVVGLAISPDYAPTTALLLSPPTSTVHSCRLIGAPAGLRSTTGWRRTSRTAADRTDSHASSASPSRRSTGRIERSSQPSGRTPWCRRRRERSGRRSPCRATAPGPPPLRQFVIAVSPRSAARPNCPSRNTLG